MDPNATLRELRQAKQDGDKRRAKELREALWNWVRQGGFEPDDTGWRGV